MTNYPQRSLTMTDWYVSKSGKTHGPFTSAQLKQLAAQAKINTATEIRMGTDGKWTPAARVKGLFAAPQAAPVATAVATAPPPLRQSQPVMSAGDTPRDSS